MKTKRRSFIKNSSIGVLGISTFATAACKHEKPKMENELMTKQLFFNISLAQWSLHRSIEAKQEDPSLFPLTARQKFGIGAVEYVNQFYVDKVKDAAYWRSLRKQAEDQDVQSLLIMVDDEGDLGNTDDAQRSTAVTNHHKWVDAAAMLGCHSIRINAFGDGSKEDVGSAMVDGLGRLCEYASESAINVLIENHGLYSSDPSWVAKIIKEIGLSNCGTLPDFGNFCLSAKWGSTQDGSCEEAYDLYDGVREMLPFAKGVSAKSYMFDESGDQVMIDYSKMLKIVKDAGFDGYIGIEYEGSDKTEEEGIKATKALLEKIGMSLS